MEPRCKRPAAGSEADVLSAAGASCSVAAGKRARLKGEGGAMEDFRNASASWTIPSGFDASKSTKDNYTTDTDTPAYYGRYAAIRAKLDTKYVWMLPIRLHKVSATERDAAASLCSAQTPTPLASSACRHPRARRLLLVLLVLALVLVLALALCTRARARADAVCAVTSPSGPRRLGTMAATRRSGRSTKTCKHASHAAATPPVPTPTIMWAVA